MKGRHLSTQMTLQTFRQKEDPRSSQTNKIDFQNKEPLLDWEPIS